MTGAGFNPKVHTIARPARHHALLVAPSGDWLATQDGRTLATQSHVDDAALWEGGADGFRHVVSGVSLRSRAGSGAGTVRLRLGDADLGPDGGAGPAAEFIVGHGPEKRPSEYLAAFRDTGWVALTCILAADVVEGLQRLGGVDGYEDAGGVPRDRQLAADPALARATVEPVSLWLCRQYMRLADIKLGHPPGVTALTPDDGERPVQGWHGDFPYMWGSDRSAGAYRVPPGADELVLGIQRNICVSDFRLENGATVFCLASHRAHAVPPAAWGRANQTWKTGHRAEHGLPYGGEDTDVIEAPAGTIILYDARIWHRAGVNRTNRPRGAVIQAITPGFVIPFYDTTAPFRSWLASDVPAQLTERERRELETLMLHRIVGPQGVFAIAPDEALTERVRARGQGPSATY
ncbi:MAG TPA: phytanoyl-CoA dioxygenase family protein [Caulobacteraceae bacterium]|nr:phytanoyl-CoA dioxygenase family protein [Caulobacteraceae bacterium]